MTEQEAKEILNRIATRNIFCTLESEQLKAFKLAEQALEKQIPMKPDYEADGYSGGELVFDYAKCPICGHDFEYGINDWEAEYCSDCGQKLDWSDEDD